MRRRIISLCLGTLLAASPAAGQVVDVDWSSRRISLDAGLPQSSVNAMAQGPDGYLWLATYGGLARFDGRRMMITSTSDEGDLTLPRILSLAQAPDGRVWAGSQGRGLGLVDGFHLRARPVDARLNGESVHALLIDRQGRVWAGTETGLARVSPSGDVLWFQTEQGLAGNQTYRLAEDAGGNIWATGYGGISRISGDRIDVRLPQFEGASFPPATIAAGAAGEVWLASAVPGGALYRWDGEQFAELGRGFLDPSERVSTMLPRQDGALILGSSTGHVGVWQGDRFLRFDARLLGQSAVTQIRPRPEGGYWVGTTSAGLIELTPRATDLVGSTERAYGSTGAVAVDGEGTVWASLDCRGVLQAPPGRPERTFDFGPCIGTLLPDGEAGLWIGTARGLYRWRPGESLAADPLVAGSVTALTRDRSGRLLVGAGGDVWRQQESGGFTRLTQRTGEGAPVNVIVEHPSGDLWFGTNTGLSTIASGTLVPDALPALAGRIVRAIHVDADGRIWIGTYGVGLWVIDADQVRSFGVMSGLPEQVVSWIGEDEAGHLWLTGNRGVHRLSRARLLMRVAGGLAVPALTIGLDAAGDPIETNGGFQPAAWWIGGDTLLVPTVSGPMRVLTTRVASPATGPPIHLEAISIDQQAISMEGTVTIRPGSRRVEFFFTGISFQHSAQLSYEHRMEPYDQAWVRNATGRAVYTALPPGHYTFQVRAINPDGLASPEPLAVAVVVVPRFTQTPAFFLLLIAGVLAATLGGAWAWSAAARAREAALTRDVERAVSELKILSGLLPICAWCKKIRNDGGYWSQLETYIQEHSQADFTHSICEDCARTVWEEHDGLTPGAPASPDDAPPIR